MEEGRSFSWDLPGTVPQSWSCMGLKEKSGMVSCLHLCLLMGKHNNFTPQKIPTWKEGNRKGRVRANPCFSSTVPNKRGVHDTQCIAITPARSPYCQKCWKRERWGDHTLQKEDSPSDPCSHAPCLTQTHTNLPTVDFHPAPYLEPQKNKGSRAFSTFHSPWLLRAPGIRPCTSFSLSCHPCLWLLDASP